MKKLETRNLRKAFNQRVVVEDISLHVEEGEIVGLLGPNGAGKTTTFHSILGLVRPDRGHIYLNGKDISPLSVSERSRRGIIFLPQEPSIFRGLTVWENLFSIAQISKTCRRDGIDTILEELGLDAIRNRKAFLLSGGERRRLEVARSLLLSPDFLLLDEPFAGIDPIQIQDLKRFLLLFKKRNMGIIITDHNVRETLTITDRSYIIKKGEVIFSGGSEALLSNDLVKREYLGREFRWN